MMAVLPMPGAPTMKTGRWWTGSMTYMPASSFLRYASTVSLICLFAAAMFIRCKPPLYSSSQPKRVMLSSSITTLIAQGGTGGRMLLPSSMKTKAAS